MAVPGGTQLVKHRLIRRKECNRRRHQMRGRGGGAHLLSHQGVVGNQDVREVANSRILRCFKCELRRLKLKLVRAARVRQEAGREHRVIEIGRRRRGTCASGKRERAAEQDPQFPHRPSPFLGVRGGPETGKEARGSDSCSRRDQAKRWTASMSGATASSSKLRWQCAGSRSKHNKALGRSRASSIICAPWAIASGSSSCPA